MKSHGTHKREVFTKLNASGEFKDLPKKKIEKLKHKAYNKLGDW